MKKRLSLIISSLMIAVFTIACSGAGQVKSGASGDQQMNVKAGSGGDFAVDAINNQIKDFSIDGFHGGSSKINQNEDLENLKKIVGLVKPIIDKVPDGYVMQITGHCADYDSKAKQKSVSTARAKKIYDELKKAGASTKKMTYRGAGTSELLEGLSGKDFQQRRVSFKAVKK